MVDRLFFWQYLDTLEARSTRGDGMLELVLFWLSRSDHEIVSRESEYDKLRFHQENRKQNKGFTVVDAQLIISIMVGLCLSAACGLKVFVPPLAAGLANQAGLLTLSENTQWLGSWPATPPLR